MIVSSSRIFGTAPTDSDFASVVLLMGFEGANNDVIGPGMTDESPAAHGLGSATGVAKISTGFSKFGSSSVMFQAPGGVLEFADHADWNFGSGNFTIEFFLRLSATGFQFIINQWFTSGTLGWVVYESGGKIAFNVSTTGTDNFNDLLGATTLSIGQWYHVMVDYDGTKQRLYIDGVMDASATVSRTINNSTEPLRIGDSGAGPSFPLFGFLDELRITKGVARCGSDSGFTVPTAAYPRSGAGAGVLDPTLITDTDTFHQPTVSVSAGAEASAFLARTSGLDSTHQTAYINLINGLVSDGVWSKLDALYVFATQDSTTALLNLVSSSYAAVTHGTPTFTADQGFTGVDGSTTVYLDTQFNPSTASSPQYVQNSAHISSWSLNSAASGGFSSGCIMGSQSGGVQTNLFPRFADGNSYYRINGSGTGGVSNSDGKGHYLVNRSASNAVQGYRNGSSVLSNSDTSSTVANANIYVLLQNNAGSPATGFGGQCPMASIGSSLSSGEATAFYTRLRAYMTAVGIP